MAASDRLQARFRAVARDRLALLRAWLDELARGQEEVAAPMRREAHGLKGEARVLGVERVADLAHALEELLAGEAPQTAAIGEALSAIEEALGGTQTSSIAEAADRIQQGYLRIDPRLLNELGRSVAEVRVLEAELRRLADELDALSDARSDARQGDARQGDALRRLGHAARGLHTEHRTRLDRLDDRLRAVRMVPLGLLLEHLPRAAKSLASDLGKLVEVVVFDAGVEVDRQIVDAIAEPLVHLVQNAVDHGLETPDERAASGKPERGKLWLSARSTASLATIEVRDDGRGIDRRALRDAAERHGQQVPDELDDEATLALLCRHGLSTRHEVTRVSGRGVGLDAVARSVEAVGGRLRKRSEAARGTAFELEVPLSTTLATVLGIEVDGARLALAPHAVVEVRGPAAGESEVSIQTSVGWAPLADLGALIGTSETRPHERPCIVVLAHGRRRLAVAVDRATGATPVVSQRLDPFLEGCALVRGIGLLPSGELAVELSTQELLQRFDRSSSQPAGPRRSSAERARTARVLVVDDSELTRDVVVSILKEMGLEVVEAVDGESATRTLASTPVDLVLTDLDMPVVDGFELVRRIRAMPSHRTLPIVVLSTRGSSADIQRASELGADAYLVKNRLELDQLRRVVGARLGAA
ncbi:MAG: response regulator [Sandaracinaceae bacterium]|nr:response regulator [Sandaracinaceae bacterium]